MSHSLFSAATLARLDGLEAEAIASLRKAAARSKCPALLFSAGKSSLCLLRLAEKAFRPERFPFPLLHIETGDNLLEVLAFRDWRAAELGARLIVHAGQRNPATDLPRALLEKGFDVGIGGFRRDAGGHGLAVHAAPIFEWSDLDVWHYIQREGLELPSIYFAHRRQVVRQNQQLQSLPEVGMTSAGAIVETLRVRFPSLGDKLGARVIESEADSVLGIIEEMGLGKPVKQTAVGSNETRSRPARALASLACA